MTTRITIAKNHITSLIATMNTKEKLTSFSVQNHTNCGWSTAKVKGNKTVIKKMRTFFKVDLPQATSIILTSTKHPTTMATDGIENMGGLGITSIGWGKKKVIITLTAINI